ncbi:sensor histidine kinase [Amycolatopsis taiwanensis]|uniref:sensor histidine kinase n=1 Tax=Amycolatopsis taiwanensis TaxID=342230 RepID=UPI0004BA3978|nr:ATP-binding protein [Amycolatopsis taiwanensis]
MIWRWPIRVRLTTAFTVMMALVLFGVAAATVAHARSVLDESIDETLTSRLGDLQSAAAAALPNPIGGRNTVEQVLDPSGAVVASSPPVSAGSMLNAGELAAARNGAVFVDHPAAGGLAGPVRLAAGPAGPRVVVAATSLAERDAAVADLRAELAVAFPLVLLAAAGGAYLLGAGALRPVERMRARAAAITAEDTDQRLPVPSARDEISRLGTTFNDLLARLQAALSRERQFVADASHELRTPLGMLTTELELALRRPRSSAELTAAMHSALEETERLSRLAQDLLLLARTDQPDTGQATRRAASTALRPVLERVATRYRPLGEGDPLAIDCAPDLSIQASEEDCERAVSNLVDNAMSHGAPPVIVKAWPAGSGQPEWVAIEVRDHGPGFDPAFLPHALERFTRADTARAGGEGTGLGLAIVAALARRNGGQVDAGNDPDGGAVLTLTLPAAPASILAQYRAVQQ